MQVHPLVPGRNARASYSSRAEAFYNTCLNVLVAASVPAAGIVLVEQEGDAAGTARHLQIPVRDQHAALTNSINEALGASLRTGKAASLPLEAEEVAYVALSGQFETTIGYVWAMQPTPPNVLETIAESILYFVDSSKKSRFHEVFSTTIRDSHGPLDIFDLISTSIRDGLFCDRVIVWEKVNSILKSRNVANLDLPERNSLAGQAIVGQSVVVHDINAYRDKAFYPTFFEENELRAAFFLPIRNTNDEVPVGVCGVFYKRPFGTTAVDRILCEYVIRYYELLWTMAVDEEHSRRALSEMSDTKDFLRDAVRCLVDFHDITSIQVQLAKDVSDASTFAHRVPAIEEPLRDAAKAVSKLKKLIETHSSSLKVAKSYAEVLIAEEDVPIAAVNVYDLVHEEIDSIARKVRSERGVLEIKVDLPQSTYRIRKADFVRVLRNLVSNAYRAIAERTQGGKSIVVRIYHAPVDQLVIQVTDNGPGIAPGLEDKIFEPLFTTNGSLGGKGLGLAIVRAVARRYGRKPKLRTQWGRYAEFEVAIDHYSGKGRK